MSDETVDEGADIAWWLKWLTRIIGALGGVSSAIGGILGMRLWFFRNVKIFFQKVVFNPRFFFKNAQSVRSSHFNSNLLWNRCINGTVGVFTFSF